MRTLTNLLAEDAARIRSDIMTLMANSGLHVDSGGGGIVFLGGSHWWDDLPLEGRRNQDKILTEYRQYRDLVRVLIRRLSDDSQREFDAADRVVVENIDQRGATWCETVPEAQAKTLDAVDKIQGLLDRLYSPEAEALVIPDTNALIMGAPLEQWSFDWCDAFTVVLTPTVLAELDELKIAHRNPEVRTKAERIIRRIKEYCRRGDLRAGVPIVTGRIKARSIAVEPKLDESLPWLDPTNNDDRLLASTIEIIRQNVRSVVVLVTGDINLQNKAQHARLPVSEPPTQSETVE
ncbi:MAG: hypothetical protein IT430_01670 [Phycisphaerales bacterium]|nr:hypothetical protein [Phycisphaerales bacterium]